MRLPISPYAFKERHALFFLIAFGGSCSLPLNKVHNQVVARFKIAVFRRAQCAIYDRLRTLRDRFLISALDAHVGNVDADYCLAHLVECDTLFVISRACKRESWYGFRHLLG